MKKPARKPQACRRCGGIGHNQLTCKLDVETTARPDGVPVRKLAPGLTGEDLARGTTRMDPDAPASRVPPMRSQFKDTTQARSIRNRHGREAHAEPESEPKAGRQAGRQAGVSPVELELRVRVRVEIEVVHLNREG